MATTTTVERSLALEGCFNFRDLGGYPAADGRRTQWRHLFRSDGLHRLTPSDEAMLAELGLATVIDLRTDDEVAERGRFAGEGIAYHHLPMIGVLPQGDETTTWVEAGYVARRYCEMLDEAGEALSEVFAILTDPSAYPAVFHCAAGRDRTGIVASLLLGLLGVPEQTIVDDYVLSRDAMARMVAWVRAEHPDAGEAFERQVPSMLSLIPEAMTMFLGRVRAQYGSLEGYLESIEMAGALPYLKVALLD